MWQVVPRGQTDFWDPEKSLEGSHINMGIWLKGITVVVSITFQENGLMISLWL